MTSQIVISKAIEDACKYSTGVMFTGGSPCEHASLHARLNNVLYELLRVSGADLMTQTRWDVPFSVFVGDSDLRKGWSIASERSSVPFWFATSLTHLSGFTVTLTQFVCDEGTLDIVGKVDGLTTDVHAYFMQPHIAVCRLMGQGFAQVCITKDGGAAI